MEELQLPEQPDHFVIYGDLLGFRDLVLTHRTAYAEGLAYRRQTPRLMGQSLALGNPLQRRLRNFHSKLDDAVTQTEWENEVAALVFSDSLFLATTDRDACMSFCQRLVNECLALHVPVRIGVGYGSFISHTFSFESTPRIKVVTTQFLGTGVVYATDAEHSLKGMRIALHPSAVNVLSKTASEYRRLLPLPVNQRNQHSTHEWNFIPVDNDWQDWGIRKGNDRKALVREIGKMKVESSDDPSVRIHYEDTLTAIDRMVHQMHTTWLPGGKR